MSTIFAIIAMLSGTIAIIGVITILGAILNGFVISILWGWFMVPIFHLPELSIIPATGISLVVSWFVSHSEINKGHETDYKKAGTALIIKPIIYLFIGYIINIFM